MPYKSLFPSIPIETQPFGQRLLDAFWKHSISNPSKKAMISAENPEHFVTYQNLYLHSLSVSAFLESKGFGHGDMAALVLPNSWEFVEIIVGAALRGGGISGASVLFTDFELERQFIDSKSKIVFCADNSLERVMKAAKNCKNIHTIVVLQVSDLELERQFIDSKSKIVFCADNSLERVMKAAKNCKNIHTIVVLQVSDRSLPYPELPFGIIPYTSVISNSSTIKSSFN
uniref:AMP-dependent synthetase/ligase domain-containing protein n=1 Tax=Panagrolaimus davidi TaxID=227884 RepID=A0A914QUZ7_9BILA